MQTDRILTAALAAISATVVWALLAGRDQWPLVVLYWVVLTVKNTGGTRR